MLRARLVPVLWLSVCALACSLPFSLPLPWAQGPQPAAVLPAAAEIPSAEVPPQAAAAEVAAASAEAAPFPVPVIELSGGPSEIGSRHGSLLGGTIRSLHDRYFNAYFRNNAVRSLAMGSAAMFEDRLLPEHRDEVRALAAGAAVDPRQMLLAQCFLDLSPMTACSTFTLPASAAPDGVARFGRTLDFPSFDVADKGTVVMVYRPAGRYRFASVGWPGMVGVLTGMNEHGLTLANMEVTRGPRLPAAMPYTLLYRTVLEQCRTVDEAVSLLRATPRQTSNNLMLMDAEGRRAVAEVSPGGVKVRRGEEGAALISTNHRRGESDTAAPGRCQRYDRLRHASAADFGLIDEPGVEAILAKVGQGKHTLQAMVFEPSERVMYLSAGKHATDGPYHRLDLKPYFAE